MSSFGVPMRRREFITLLKVVGGTTAVWPAIVMAQQPALPIVAFVGGGTADSAANYSAAFRKGLSESGYVAGSGHRRSERRPDRGRSLARHLDRRSRRVVHERQ